MKCYKIICPKCSMTVEPNKILYSVPADVAGAVLSDGEAQADSGKKKKDNKSSTASPLVGGLGESWEDSFPVGEQDRVLTYVTLDKLKREKLVAVKAEASSDYEDDIIDVDEEPVSLYTYGTGETGHKIYRCCPNCMEPLPYESGFIPTFSFLLYGKTDSGKSVYFMQCVRHLGRGRDDKASTLSVEWADIAGDQGTICATRVNLINIIEIFNTKGELPPSTYANETKLKIVLKATVNDNSCLIYFSDSPGELAIVNSVERIRPHFENSNGLIFFVPFDALRDAETRRGVMANCNAVTRPEIQPIVPKNSCVILSQFDKIFDTKRVLNVTHVNPCINAKLISEDAKRETKYSADYVNLMDNGTRDIIRNYHDELPDIICRIFKNASFCSVSALGRHNGDGKVVIDVEGLSPIRLADPLWILLNKVGFITFDDEIMDSDAKKNDDLIGRIVEWFRKKGRKGDR